MEYVMNLSQIVLRLPFQSLQHSEHVQRELGELDLVHHVAYNDDLLQRKCHHGTPFNRRSYQWIEPMGQYDAVAVRIQDVDDGICLDEGFDFSQH